MTADPELPFLSERYRLVRVVGSGGMATVYLADDLKHHRRVAVKVMKPEIARAIGHDGSSGRSGSRRG
jgi:serine/threonine-protein kinase